LTIGPSVDPGQPVRQAWGKNFGSPISIQGLQVRAQKSLFLSTSTLDEGNSANISVLKSLGARICFTASNGAAKVVDSWLLPVTICPSDSNAKIGGAPQGPTTISVQDPNMSIMAQMTDVHLYMQKVGKFGVHQAEALVGTVPNLIGRLNGNRAFTP